MMIKINNARTWNILYSQNMKMATLVKIINEVLDESGRDNASAVCRDSRLRADLGLDSLDLAVLTVKIEAKFGVDVFANGIVNTVGEILDRIDGK